MKLYKPRLRNYGYLSKLLLIAIEMVHTTFI